jgi:hypothetical protein
MASSAEWEVPPLVKAYEALGAVGDDRVRILGNTRAIVTSSSGRKKYEVEVSADGHEISSNDNASYWRGYLGYPAIAVLIERGLYRAPANVTDALAGIPWQEINRRNRNNYAKTLAEVDKLIEENGHDPDAVRSEAEALLDYLTKLKPRRGTRRRPPSEKSKPR